MSGYSRSVALVLLLLSPGAVGRAGAADDPWSEFRFLLGEWVGEGKAGQGSGRFTLATELQGKILVRRHRAELPTAAGRPAATHEDLMVVYREPGGKQLKASYFDSEGNVIQYAVSASPDKQSLTFVSDPKPAAPRFRLTYTKEKEGTVAVKFEITPPGKPDGFRTYLEGSVRRIDTPKR
jgi:hypothetical protein